MIIKDSIVESRMFVCMFLVMRFGFRKRSGTGTRSALLGLSVMRYERNGSWTVE